MADQQHRATAQQWRDVKAMAFGSLAYSTILELRDRIKALEATTTAKPNQTSSCSVNPDTPHQGVPAS